jgi:Ca2+:H+ antiporter
MGPGVQIANDRDSFLSCIPISLVLKQLMHASPVWVFLTGAVAIAALNITFGSIAELLLAQGDVALVKAQITGSTLGTSRFGLGMAMLVGGLSRARSRARKRAGACRDPWRC